VDQSFEIIKVTKAILAEALEKDTFWRNEGTIPFSKSKAKWLLANPRMDDEDICAVVVYENDVIISFVYLIPDMITLSDKTIKIYWFRRWWVADKYKDSIISSYLMNDAVKEVDGQVVIKFLAKNIESFYKRLPYQEFGFKTRYFILFELILRRLKFLLRPIQSLSANFVRRINRKRIRKSTSKMVYEYITFLDENTWAFIQPFVKNDLVPKTIDYVNWQLDSSQYTKTTVSGNYPYVCLISGAFENIEIVNFKVEINQHIVGFISYLIRGTEFIVKYFIADKNYYQDCVNALMDHFIRYDVNTIHAEDDQLANSILKRFVKVYVDQRKVYSLANKGIDSDFSDVELFQRDGNFA